DGHDKSQYEPGNLPHPIPPLCCGIICPRGFTSAFFNARGAPPPLALARRRRCAPVRSAASLGPQALRPVKIPRMARYVLRVNGKDREVDAEPGDSLLSVLLYDFGLTGSRYGCGEGQCGACTVLLDGAGARSCVTRVGAVGAKAVTTIEGLATAGLNEPADTDNARLHPVQ